MSMMFEMMMDKWDQCAADIDVEELKGRVCYGGLDLSSPILMTLQIKPMFPG